MNDLPELSDQKIARALAEYAGRGVPPTADVLPHVRRLLAQRQQCRSQPKRMRLRAVNAFAVVLLAVVGMLLTSPEARHFLVSTAPLLSAPSHVNTSLTITSSATSSMDKSRQERHHLPRVVGSRGPVEAIAWLPDGKQFILVTPRTVDFYDTASLKLVRILEKPASLNVLGSGVTFSRNGQRMIVHGPTKSDVWDVGIGVNERTDQWVRQSLPSPGARCGSLAERIAASSSGQPDTFSPDNRWLACVVDTGIHVFAADTGALHRQFEWSTIMTATRANTIGAWPASLAFSEDGKRLAAVLVGEATAEATVWDVTSGKVVRQIYIYMDDVTPALDSKPDSERMRSCPAVQLSRDGTRIVLQAQQGVFVYSVEGGKRLSRLDERCLSSVAFSPDGKRLIGYNGDLQIIDVDRAVGAGS